MSTHQHTAPLVNRTDDRYSAGMETTTMRQELPVAWVHLDDFSECTAHDVCGRTVIFPGGRPEAFPSA